jgi:hypothetical protein
LAHRVVSRRRSNSVAFGAERTFSEPRNRIYEYAPLFSSGIAEDEARPSTSTNFDGVIGVGHLLQSSSASRLTAGASGFLNFNQSGERPDL